MFHSFFHFRESKCQLLENKSFECLLKMHRLQCRFRYGTSSKKNAVQDKRIRTTTCNGGEGRKLVKSFIEFAYLWIFHSNFDESIVFWSALSLFNLFCLDYKVTQIFTDEMESNLLKHPVNYFMEPHGVVIIVFGKGHGDPSSNPG